jgi:hypothetical protein
MPSHIRVSVATIVLYPSTATLSRQRGVVNFRCSATRSTMINPW